MKPSEIEAWALQVIELVKNHNIIEDSRVELKADWISHQEAARRIAGHANASRGDNILWIVGIDEVTGKTTSKTKVEFLDWYSKVQSEFDTLAPTTVDVVIPVEDTTVVAVLFENDRAPFLVKNHDSGKIKFEVPWREKTAVRTATRSDLLKLLVPANYLPEIEILQGELTASYPSWPNPTEINWSLEMYLYIIPKDERRLVIPFYSCEAIVDPFEQLQFFHHGNWRRPFPIKFTPPAETFFHSLTINATNSEVIITGPGLVGFHAWTSSPVFPFDTTNEIRANIKLKFQPLNSYRTLEPLFVKADHITDGSGGKWLFKKRDG